jgi:catechol 2,3-dioxygenase-like lactoylglutathione lyase family enzyme
MKITEVAFTGYPVTDLKRARNFYENVLGLKATKIFGDENQAWIEYDIGPSTLSIGNGASDWNPSAGGGSVGLEVEDFAAAIDTLKRNQVPFRLEPIETPVCHMAAVSDPDGNSIVIHKRKKA